MILRIAKHAEHHHATRHREHLAAGRGRSTARSRNCGLVSCIISRHAERQQAQDPGRHPALGRQHAHLAQQLEAVADDGADVAEQFGQVAARFALDQHRDHEVAQVGAGMRVARLCSASFIGTP